ncbi:hypothetical protein AGOR_G00157910 [Albula goreensis]|uniref:Opioid growth factor receptor (OGFr) conserved domain-containing protein n=1 Tax=Albula goreensis TaxID=1534307 RepID=A0A8T3D3H2_9TELE|nr:hypothetical protein AGOR_G00157910 [Albula goreensis]
MLSPDLPSADSICARILCSILGSMSSKSSWEDEDDLVCEYDSTWDGTESDEEESLETKNLKPSAKKRSGHQWNYGYSVGRNLRAAEDMQNYRHGYPEKDRSFFCNMYRRDDMDDEDMVNLYFYRNIIPSSPDKVSIEEFHMHWKGDYRRLERVHSYIQWLFPLQEPGMNYSARELTKKEIEVFRKDEEAKQRLVKSYELMLDFYGIQLIDETTGEVQRSDNWQQQFYNLNQNTHNNLRITRILKSLGELGFQHFQAPLVRFFLKETLIEHQLERVKQSVLDYFLFAVRDKKERMELIKYAFLNYYPKDEFVWCPRKMQRRWLEEGEMSDGTVPKEDCAIGKTMGGQENEMNFDSCKVDQFQGSSVDSEFKSSSVEQPTRDNRQMAEPSSQDTGSIDKDSPSKGHTREPGDENTGSPSVGSALQICKAETAQEEDKTAEMESKRLTTKSQPNDIENIRTIDTSIAEQNDNEMSIKNDSSDSLTGETPNPPGKAVAGLTISSDTAELPKSSESLTATAGVQDADCHKFKDEVAESISLSGEGANNHTVIGAAENSKRQSSNQAEELESQMDGAAQSSKLEVGTDNAWNLEAGTDIHTPNGEANDTNSSETEARKSPRPDTEELENQKSEAETDKSSRPEGEGAGSNIDQAAEHENPGSEGAIDNNRNESVKVEKHQPEMQGNEKQNSEGGVKDKEGFIQYCDGGAGKQQFVSQFEASTDGLREEAAHTRGKTQNPDDMLCNEEPMIIDNSFQTAEERMEEDSSGGEGSVQMEVNSAE